MEGQATAAGVSTREVPGSSQQQCKGREAGKCSAHPGTVRKPRPARPRVAEQSGAAGGNAAHWVPVRGEISDAQKELAHTCQELRRDAVWRCESSVMQAQVRVFESF